MNEDFPPCTFCTEKYDQNDRFYPPEEGFDHEENSFCSAECYAYWLSEQTLVLQQDAWNRGFQAGYIRGKRTPPEAVPSCKECGAPYSLGNSGYCFDCLANR